MTAYATAVADFMSSIPFPALLIVKSTVVLAAGGFIAFLLRTASASARHTVWALTLATVVALPIGMIAAPAWRVPIASAHLDIPLVEPDPVAPIGTALPKAVGSPADQQAAPSITTPVPESVTLGSRFPDSSPFFIWLAGMIFVVARMIAGRYSLSRLTRRSTELRDDAWKSIVRRESSKLAIEKTVRVFESESVSTPLTAGFRSPFIILPANAGEWSSDHRKIVLRHELAHIARGDALVCLLSGIACAIYWFNPLVWVAARKLRSEQERACDDRVITLGTPAPDYAAHLLEVARSAREMGMHSFVSVAMARPSQLEGRLLAVLANRRRGSLTRSKSAFAGIAAFATLAIVSAVQPVQAESAVILASQADLPGVFVVAPMAKATPVADSTSAGDVAVQSGGTLVLDLKTGASVSITGSDVERVRMDATLSGRDWRNSTVSIRGDGSDAVITMDYRRRDGSQSSSHRLAVSVPRRFNVRIESAGGSVTIRDVEGTFNGTTGGGEIRIENARGRAELTTGGGPVTVKNSRLSGSVTTGGGSVLIQDVEGGLTGRSGSGNVLYGGSSATGAGSGIGSGTSVGGGVGKGVTFSEESANGARRGSDGRLYVRQAGGRVIIDSAPGGASISTGGGEIRVGSSSGDVDARTGGGDVIVGPTSGAVDVSTGAGDVKVTVAGKGSDRVRVTSGNGNVTISLPADMSADLDLETAFTQNRRSGATRIESDWPLSTTMTPDWDPREGTPRRYVRARTSIGNGGATISVKTVNGDIIIRKR